MSSWFLTYGFAEVHPGLLVGAYPLDGEDVELLGRLGVRRIVNLVQDAEYPPGARTMVGDALAEAGIEEDRLPTVDYGGLPAAWLEQAVGTVVGALDAGQRTYVHCRAGWQRSAAVAAGAVALREAVGIDEALDRVTARKPRADPLPHQREDLHRWWASRQAGPPRNPVAEPAPTAERTKDPATLAPSERRWLP